MDARKKTTIPASEKVAKMQTTKRELSIEAREFISNAAISIIKDVLPDKSTYSHCLCSIGVNYNEENKEFDSAMINIFDIPQSTTAFVPVLQVVIDLTEQKVAGQNNFVSPVVFRKDKDGNEVGVVLLGRNGDIDIMGANIVAQIMANVPDDEAPVEEVEHVEGEVVK